MAELRHVTELRDSDFGRSTQWLNSGDKGGKKQNEADSGLDNPAFHELEPTNKQNHTGDMMRDAEATSESSRAGDDDDDNGFSRFVGQIQKGVRQFSETYSATLWLLFYIVLLIAYFTYFGFAMYHRFGDEGSWRLMIGTVLGSFLLAFHLITQYRASSPSRIDRDESGPHKVVLALETVVAKTRLAILLPVLLMLGFLVFIIVDIAIDRPRNLISCGGLCFYIIFMFVFSHNPAKVKWRPVFWGVALQVIFAVLILRTSWGYDTFSWLGKRVTEFLANTDAGSAFVFGEQYELHFFAFKVLPVVIFFSTVVSVLYYLGVMQGVIKQLGRFLCWCLGTSPAESVNAAGNIFIGQVPANHLLSASVMSAPAALAISKLFYPETETPKHRGADAYNMGKGGERNLIEAASNGASMSIKLVANIAVNLIAFVALLQFVNSTLVWFGDRVGYEDFTFQLVCSYVFWPLAFLMGVDYKDCRVVAELLGIKTFLNEFVAYVTLSKYITNRLTLDEYLVNATNNVTGNLTGLWEHRAGDIYLFDTDVTLKHGLISDRSMVIATYALCGFSNLASMGVQLGGLGALAPSRKSDMSKIVVRAMIAGNVACFMTACIAGLFYEGDF
ncbi:solute carrier family 28 member 3-like [Elysia marginata]|uniref:Solute carrier family 28 member 3-like n=1 Tax=Elysia marginata TaxID=1093978 RepID=A0AAV4G363_9GAST|nr:solute carrier family 28 member 3-like [Elysia marginata]